MTEQTIASLARLLHTFDEDTVILAIIEWLGGDQLIDPEEVEQQLVHWRRERS